MDEGLCLFLKLIHLNSISNPSKRGETHGFGFSFRPELTFLSHEQHAHTTKTIGEKTFLASSTPFPVNVIIGASSLQSDCSPRVDLHVH